LFLLSSFYEDKHAGTEMGDFPGTSCIFLCKVRDKHLPISLEKCGWIPIGHIFSADFSGVCISVMRIQQFLKIC
jgi:hypothetical protein